MLLVSRETHVETVYIMLSKSIEEQFNEAVRKSSVKYALDKSISGYYRLVVYNEENSDYELIHDDSACEDVYDQKSAMALFIDIIKERHNL